MATKVALVTGGALGIGKGIIRMLLKDGYKVLSSSILNNNYICFLKKRNYTFEVRNLIRRIYI